MEQLGPINLQILEVLRFASKDSKNLEFYEIIFLRN